MSAPSPRLTIGALANAAGVGVETIRFYQRRGLMPEPAKPLGGIRRYDASHLARLKFIRSAQRLGFSLDEVAQLLQLDDGAHCREAAELASAHLRDVRARLVELRRMEAVLSQLVAACRTRRGRVSCPLIEALH